MRPGRHQPDCPPPPMPADPMRCRWCRCRRLLYEDGTTFCPSGCAQNDNPLYRGHCQTCGREFNTGNHHMVDFCAECDARAMATTQLDQVEFARGYQADRRRAGANREAMKIKRG